MLSNKKMLIWAVVIVLIGIVVYVLVSRNMGELKELTEEEKIEDFRYMYDIMKDNYPHFHSIEKMYGYDWLAHKEEFEKEIRETKNNMEFFYAMNDTLMNKLHDQHTCLLDPNYYSAYLNVMKEYKLAHEAFKPFEKMFKSSDKRYKQWLKLFENEHPNYYNHSKDNFALRHKMGSSINLQIVEKNKIAYLRLPYFVVDYGTEQKEYEKEKREIIDFLKSVKNYPYLIIDISGNGGGSSIYWLATIVDPLLNQELNEVKYENICIVRGGDYPMKYFEESHPDIRTNKIE